MKLSLKFMNIVTDTKFLVLQCTGILHVLHEKLMIGAINCNTRSIIHRSSKIMFQTKLFRSMPVMT